MIKKTFLFILALIAGLLLALAAVHYHSDIPLEELKARHAYPDSRFVEVRGFFFAKKIQEQRVVLNEVLNC